MNREKTISTVILIILLTPVIFYFFKPEINMDNQYIKFSWNQSLQEIKSAIKNKDIKQIFNNIYGNFMSMFKDNKIRKGIGKTYSVYSEHTHREINKLVKKWKNFIS